jgi:hypothetical protein
MFRWVNVTPLSGEQLSALMGAFHPIYQAAQRFTGVSLIDPALPQLVPVACAATPEPQGCPGSPDRMHCAHGDRRKGRLGS